MSVYEPEKKIRELRELQSLIDEAEQEAEAIRDTIKAQMEDKEELRAGKYKVTWKVITSSRLDTAALKKELPEIANRYIKVTTTLRFCVS